MTFVCPICKGGLETTGVSYRCLPCSGTYPVICGIPDFRLTPDPYIGIAEDREKGRLLAEAGRNCGFEELIRHYYAITPEDPPDLAKYWIARALVERDIARFNFDAYGLSGRRFLDVGCSTGAMLAAAAEHCDSVTGIDVAFRWLIIGAVRLRELGIKANLVCANAEYLPFPAESFDAVTAMDLLEHVPQPKLAVSESFRVSRPSARNVFRTNNRYAPTPEPHVHLWGVGLLPRRWQKRYVAARRKDLHPYAITLLSADELAGLCREAGYRAVATSAAVLHAPQFKNQFLQSAIRAYNTARLVPLTGGLLRQVGPLLVSVAER